MTDPQLFLLILIVGAFCAAFVIGAVGFADALILNALWLQVMLPIEAIPLVVACGFVMHVIPLYKLRKELDFSNFWPFALAGIIGVPIGTYALNLFEPQAFKWAIGALLVFYGIWMLLRPNTSIGTWGGKPADGAVGLSGGVLGGFAGLSGLLPTLWVGLRGWPRHVQRGTFQPFVLFMHFLGLITFSASGMVTSDTISNFLICLPVIAFGSWLGVKVYPFLNEVMFRRVILGLLLLSGISLLL